jgi:DNA-directed RNA polymerase subunit RPC12/RpoP
MKKELLLAAMGLASLTPGCVKTGSESASTTDPQLKGEVAATKPDIDKLLKRLADKPVPTELNLGAMCYKMAMPPDRAEYVCTACGAKTIHSTKENLLSGGWDSPALSVKYYRTYIEELKKLGLDAKLDESFLCSKCKKEGQSSLFLEVTIKNRVVRSALVDINDLSKLIAFVQGNLVWKGERDEDFPLKPELPRIRQLLGIEK